jgi:hypothetical protein
MPTSFSVEYEGRRIELVPESSWSGDRVRLLIDGDQVADAKPAGADTVVEADGIVVRAVLPWHGTSITRAELVRDEGEPLPLEPEPGSRAARRARFERERPGLYAARHVAKGVGQALLAVLGIALIVRFLPSIPLPAIDLPDLNLPVPSIDVPVPDIELPGWLKAVIEAKEIWFPILVGIFVARREWRRRRTRRPPTEPVRTPRRQP